MKSFIEELEFNRDINMLKGLENRVDIDYVIERLKEINNHRLYQAYINEITSYIECEKEYDSVKNNENGVLDYLNSLQYADISEIADKMINDDYFNEQLNNTIA